MSTRTAIRPPGGRSAAPVGSRPVVAFVPEASGERAAGPDLASWVLRGGLAFAFAYAAVAMVLDDAVFVSYAPAALQRPGLAGVALPAFAAYELLLAAGLALGRRVLLVSVLSALTLVTIVVLNLDAFGTLFRNVPIACAATALALQSRASAATGAAGRCR